MHILAFVCLSGSKLSCTRGRGSLSRRLRPGCTLGAQRPRPARTTPTGAFPSCRALARSPTSPGARQSWVATLQKALSSRGWSSRRPGGAGRGDLSKRPSLEESWGQASSALARPLADSCGLRLRSPEHLTLQAEVALGPGHPARARLLRPGPCPPPPSPASPPAAPRPPALPCAAAGGLPGALSHPSSPRPWVPDVRCCLRDRWCFGSLRGQRRQCRVERSLRVCRVISL